ncbi:MAG TPA: DNA repair and recombination protein RadB [Thermoplasmata archaeon]|nr:DNA repair and recombination protein RadB [Thermoplasmata archaeon]
MDHVPIGCAALDELLGGGIEAGCLTLLYGEAGSGKTNLCLQVARNVAREERRVVYVDTEGVSLDRLRQMSGDDYESILARILFSEPYSNEEQEKLIGQAVKMVDQTTEIGLIIVDSVTMHYRLTLRDDDPEERRSLARQVARLLRASRKSDIPVLLTSQVYTDIERGSIEPLGGHMLSHNCKTLVRLEKAGPALRRAVRVKHRHLAEGHSVKFRLTERGIEDV